MNTKQTTENSSPELPLYHLNREESQEEKFSCSTNKAEDTGILHKAEIITPQPYGVFALCKIYEHFQIN